MERVVMYQMAELGERRTAQDLVCIRRHDACESACTSGEALKIIQHGNGAGALADAD